MHNIIKHLQASGLPGARFSSQTESLHELSANFPCHEGKFLNNMTLLSAALVRTELSATGLFVLCHVVELVEIRQALGLSVTSPAGGSTPFAFWDRRLLVRK